MYRGHRVVNVRYHYRRSGRQTRASLYEAMRISQVIPHLRQYTRPPLDFFSRRGDEGRQNRWKFAIFQPRLPPIKRWPPPAHAKPSGISSEAACHPVDFHYRAAVSQTLRRLTLFSPTEASVSGDVPHLFLRAVFARTPAAQRISRPTEAASPSVDVSRHSALAGRRRRCRRTKRAVTLQRTPAADKCLRAGAVCAFEPEVLRCAVLTRRADDDERRQPPTPPPPSFRRRRVFCFLLSRDFQELIYRPYFD